MSCNLCSEEAPLSEAHRANMDVNTAPSVHISSFFFKSAVDRRPTRSNQIPTDSFKSAFHLQLVKLNRLTSFAVTHLMQSYIKTAYHSRDTSAHSAHLILQHQHQLQLHTKHASLFLLQIAPRITPRITLISSTQEFLSFFLRRKKKVANYAS